MPFSARRGRAAIDARQAAAGSAAPVARGSSSRRGGACAVAAGGDRPDGRDDGRSFRGPLARRGGRAMPLRMRRGHTAHMQQRRISRRNCRRSSQQHPGPKAIGIRWQPSHALPDSACAADEETSVRSPRRASTSRAWLGRCNAVDFVAAVAAAGAPGRRHSCPRRRRRAAAACVCSNASWPRLRSRQNGGQAHGSRWPGSPRSCGTGRRARGSAAGPPLSAAVTRRQISSTTGSVMA